MPTSQAIRVRHGAWRRLKASPETGVKWVISPCHRPPDPQPWTTQPPTPRDLSSADRFLPRSVQALSSRPASRACRGPQRWDWRTREAQAWTCHPSHVHTAGILEDGNLGPRRREATWRPGTEAAEMLLRAGPPAASTGTPLGSGGSQGAAGTRAPDGCRGRATRPRCSAGGPRQSPLEAVTAEKAALSKKGHGCAQEGDSRTVRGSISLTTVAGDGEAREFPGPRPHYLKGPQELLPVVLLSDRSSSGLTALSPNSRQACPPRPRAEEVLCVGRAARSPASSEATRS